MNEFQPFAMNLLVPNNQNLEEWMNTGVYGHPLYPCTRRVKGEWRIENSLKGRPEPAIDSRLRFGWSGILEMR